MRTTFAPFTNDQIASINEFQNENPGSLFCRLRHHPLVVSNDGIRCPQCLDYLETFVDESITDWSWKKDPKYIIRKLKEKFFGKKS